MNERQKVLSNFFWRFMERCGAQSVSFVVSIVLARLLAPSVYGTIALVGVFTSIVGVFVDSGMANALIQKKNADDVDFSTVFYFNIAMCLVLYGLLFLAAPLIADFYVQPELTPVIRVLGLMIVISGVKNVQQAYVSRHMMFKRFFYSTLGGTIGAAVVGIWMAYHGFGVWALVGQYLFNNLLDTIILWLTVKWRPKRFFSWQRLRSLFSYGSKLLASAVLNTVYSDLRSLIIGKLYTTEDLAFYNRGGQFPSLIISNINSSISSVLLPTMSAQQDDVDRVRAMTRRSIRVSTYLMMPMMTGLAVCAEPLVRLVLTEKWLPCVPYLQLCCFGFAFYPIHTANLSAIQAMGRSDLYLRLEIIKKVLDLIVLSITMWFGVMAMAASVLYMSFVGQIVNAWPNRKLLNYRYEEQVLDMLPQIALSLAMGAIVYAAGLVLPANDWIRLLVQVPLGVAVYLAGSILFKLESFRYVMTTVKEVVRQYGKR